MRARLTDPLGPFWRRVLRAWPVKTREVDLELGVGSIAFRDSLIVRRIHARDVLGASTARTRRGVVLSLVTRWRNRRPVTFEVANDADATTLRHALGIGHRGFGEIAMPTDRDVATRGEHVVGAFAVMGVVISVWIAIAGDTWSRDWMATLLEMSSALFYLLSPIVVLVAMVIQRRIRSSGLALSERSARVRGVRGWTDVAYADIKDVYADEKGLRFTMKRGGDVAVHAAAGRWGRERPSMEEIEIVAAQIVSAVQRARGAGEPAPSLPLRVTDLAKTEDSPRAWLARLDATASTLRSDGGYRGASFDEADLWATVDSADSPPDLRAAAARILVRAVGDRAKQKLDEILPRVRVDDDLEKIRIALDDDDERAAAAWTSIEKRDARRSRAV